MYIIVDGKNFAYRALHMGFRPIQNVNGQEISIVQFVLLRIKEIISNYDNIKGVVFCWDSNGSKKRKDLYSEYKANRNKNNEDLNKIILLDQIEELKRCLPLFGIKQICIPDYEADDAIYVLSKYYDQMANEEVLVITSDKDLLQVISRKVKVLNLNKRKTINIHNFEDIVGIPKDSYVDYLSLIGDSSDNIDGIKDIGPETAKKIIAKYGTLQNLLEKKEEIRTLVSLGQVDSSFSKRLIKIFEPKNIEKFNRNKKLIGFTNLISSEDAISILNNFAENNNGLKMDYNRVVEYIKDMYLSDIYNNVDLFLVPFKQILNNK